MFEPLTQSNECKLDFLLCFTLNNLDCLKTSLFHSCPTLVFYLELKGEGSSLQVGFEIQEAERLFLHKYFY